jgi:hypothetical protein
LRLLWRLLPLLLLTAAICRAASCSGLWTILLASLLLLLLLLLLLGCCNG